MKLPTKPIEKIFIQCAGDRSVGIPDRSYEATCYLDLSCFSFKNSKEAWKWLEEIRQDFQKLYDEKLDGDCHSIVLFDFEAEQIAAYEKHKECLVESVAQFKFHD